MISNDLFTKVLTFLMNEATDIAIGTGSAPTETDTVLQGEVLRKLISDKNLFEDTLVFEVFFDENEGNDQIFTNTGLFGTSLMSGGALDVQKNSLQTLTLSYEVTVSRGE